MVTSGKMVVKSSVSVHVHEFTLAVDDVFIENCSIDTQESPIPQQGSFSHKS